mmetsp:Transcript_42499/g.109264  ORF Transcript_42499/g.109264 Transcript_42499/m.109264 type:complete len:541 (-) Transcript_42499:446-2068(-)
MELDGRSDAASVNSAGGVSALIRHQLSAHKGGEKLDRQGQRGEPEAEVDDRVAELKDEVVRMAASVRREKRRAEVAEAEVETLRLRLEERDEQLVAMLEKEKARLAEMKSLRNSVKAQVAVLSEETVKAMSKLDESRVDKLQQLAEQKHSDGMARMWKERAKQAEADLAIAHFQLEEMEAEMEAIAKKFGQVDEPALSSAVRESVERRGRAGGEEQGVKSLTEVLQSVELSEAEGGSMSREDVDIEGERPKETGSNGKLGGVTPLWKIKQNRMGKKPDVTLSLSVPSLPTLTSDVEEEEGGMSGHDEEGQENEEEAEEWDEKENRAVSEEASTSTNQLPAFKLSGPLARAKSKRRLKEVAIMLTTLLRKERSAKLELHSSFDSLCLLLDETMSFLKHLVDMKSELERRVVAAERESGTAPQHSGKPSPSLPNRDRYYALLERRLQFQHVLSGKLAEEARKWKDRWYTRREGERLRQEEEGDEEGGIAAEAAMRVRRRLAATSAAGERVEKRKKEVAPPSNARVSSDDEVRCLRFLPSTPS